MAPINRNATKSERARGERKENREARMQPLDERLFFAFTDRTASAALSRFYYLPSLQQCPERAQ